MANKISQNTEKNINAPSEKQRPGQKEEQKEREIRETSKEFIEGVNELVEGVEAAEVSEGEVSESAKEGKRKAPTGAIGATDKAAVASKAMPSIEIMQIQIATQVKNEIKVLEKQAARMLRNPAEFSAFKLNGIVAKIRELKDILAGLAYATVETVKGWWMKFVKGITI
jgi:hypothetical protein